MGETYKKTLADAKNCIKKGNSLTSLFGLRDYWFDTELNKLHLHFYRYPPIILTYVSIDEKSKNTLDLAIDANAKLEAYALCPHIDFK